MLHVLTSCWLKYSVGSVKSEYKHQDGVSDVGIIRIGVVV